MPEDARPYSRTTSVVPEASLPLCCTQPEQAQSSSLTVRMAAGSKATLLGEDMQLCCGERVENETGTMRQKRGGSGSWIWFRWGIRARATFWCRGTAPRTREQEKFASFSYDGGNEPAYTVEKSVSLPGWWPASSPLTESLQPFPAVGQRPPTSLRGSPAQTGLCFHPGASTPLVSSRPNCPR